MTTVKWALPSLYSHMKYLRVPKRPFQWRIEAKIRMGECLGKCMRVAFTEGGDLGWLAWHALRDRANGAWAPAVPLIFLSFIYFCMYYDYHGLVTKVSKHHVLLHHNTFGRQRSSRVCLKNREAGELTQRHTWNLCNIRDVNIGFLCLWLIILILWRSVFSLQKQKKWGWLLVMGSQNFNDALFLSKCAEYLVTLNLLIGNQN